jgi:UDP-N-acetylmuramate--alanine ligase
MSPSSKISPDENLVRLISEAWDKILAWQPGFTGRWLLVDVFTQHLFLLEATELEAAWPVSTAACGLDNREDSGGTPPGLHRVHRKIGQDAEPGMIFASRKPTGILWRQTDDQAPEPAQDDLILSRILTLDGLEDGVNRGPGIDSRARYIYIHGTNHEQKIGLPESGGCVRMTNIDVVELFSLVEEGDPVVIL